MPAAVIWGACGIVAVSRTVSIRRPTDSRPGGPVSRAVYLHAISFWTGRNCGISVGRPVVSQCQRDARVYSYCSWERSATFSKRLTSDLISLSRFSRTAASSTITITFSKKLSRLPLIETISARPLA